MATFTNRSPTQVSVQPVQIISVDLIGMRAVAQTKNNTQVAIDLNYYVGGIHVTPVTGDQWIVRWYGNSWILDTQLAYNTTELATVAANPTQGMTQVGSTNPAAMGPTHLNGSLISANAPLNLGTYTTASRPDPTSVPTGTIIWNSDLSQIQTSNGITWSALTGSGGGTPGLAGQSIFGEAVSGTKNGTNLSFTTSQTFVTGSTSVFRNGVRELLNVTYTEIAPNTIHFSTAPLSDDSLLCDYLGPTTTTGTAIYGETPTGVKNGTNAVFTLANHYQAGTVQLYRNALRESNPANFTETLPNQITLVTPPLSSDDLTVDYLTST